MIRKIEGGEMWACFRGVKNPVKGLWVDGEFGVEDVPNCVAVVGSRRITQYGRQVMEKLVWQLVSESKIIVSGFMYGADQMAHKLALEAGGRTVAVLGWGIKYSKVEEEDKKLWRRMVGAGGAVISEWEHQTPAYWTFPARDRIMAALAAEVYVVEAASKSGSLITAQMARELGKTVWAVPGSVFSSVSAGTNSLIAEGKARMWLPKLQMTINIQSISKDIDIATVLQNEILSADEISLKLHRPVAEVLQELTMMILSGTVAETNGKYHLVTS